MNNTVIIPPAKGVHRWGGRQKVKNAEFYAYYVQTKKVKVDLTSILILKHIKVPQIHLFAPCQQGESFARYSPDVCRLTIL